MSYLSDSESSVSSITEMSSSGSSRDAGSRGTRSLTPSSGPPSSTDSDDSSKGTPVPLSRSEYASFAYALRKKEHRRSRSLSHRLLSLSTPRTSVAPSSRAASPTTVTTPLQLEEEAEDVVREKLDDRWPLALKHLPPAEEFEDMIKSTAHRIIFQDRMKRPRVPLDNVDLVGRISSEEQEANVNLNGDEDLDLDLEVDDHEPAIPSDLIQSTTEFINKVLVGLAVMHPSATNADRKNRHPTGWEGVLASAMLAEFDPDVIERANKRVRKLFQGGAQQDEEHGNEQGEGEGERAGDQGVEPEDRDGQTEDRFSHRLTILSTSLRERNHNSIEDLYPSTLPPRFQPKRPHQSKEETARRENRRKAKAERRAVRESVKQEQAKRKAEEKRAKREAKKSAQDMTPSNFPPSSTA